MGYKRCRDAAIAARCTWGKNATRRRPEPKPSGVHPKAWNGPHRGRILLAKAKVWKDGGEIKMTPEASLAPLAPLARLFRRSFCTFLCFLNIFFKEPSVTSPFFKALVLHGWTGRVDARNFQSCRRFLAPPSTLSWTASRGNGCESLPLISRDFMSGFYDKDTRLSFILGLVTCLLYL